MLGDPEPFYFHFNLYNNPMARPMARRYLGLRSLILLIM